MDRKNNGTFHQKKMFGLQTYSLIIKFIYLNGGFIISAKATPEDTAKIVIKKTIQTILEVIPRYINFQQFPEVS